MQSIKASPASVIVGALHLALLGNNISQVQPGDATRSLIVSFVLALILWLFLDLCYQLYHCHT
jgi:hypothetical protein